jgi:hypothetical protein
MAASDPGIPPAPPDTAGHVGEVRRGGCPGSGLREVGIPGECRGHVSQALALDSRQRTGYWECGGRYGSCRHGASGIMVARCSRHLPCTSVVTMPPSLTHFYPSQKPHSPGLSGKGYHAQRHPPEVRIWALRNPSRVGTHLPSTATPHCPACGACRGVVFSKWRKDCAGGGTGGRSTAVEERLTLLSMPRPAHVLRHAAVGHCQWSQRIMQARTRGCGVTQAG